MPTFGNFSYGFNTELNPYTGATGSLVGSQAGRNAGAAQSGLSKPFPAFRPPGITKPFPGLRPPPLLPWGGPTPQKPFPTAQSLAALQQQRQQALQQAQQALQPQGPVPAAELPGFNPLDPQYADAFQPAPAPYDPRSGGVLASKVLANYDAARLRQPFEQQVQAAGAPGEPAPTRPLPPRDFRQQFQQPQYGTLAGYRKFLQQAQQARTPHERAIAQDALARQLTTSLQRAGHQVKWQNGQLIIDGRPYTIGGSGKTIPTRQPEGFGY